MKCATCLAWTGLALFSLASSAGCQRTLATCDITQRACQEDIYYKMLSLRGDAYDPFGGLPPVVVITEDQYRQQLEQDQGTQDGPHPWNQALTLLHFYPPAPVATPDGGASADGGAASSSIEDQVTHVYAFYSNTRKDVTVIAHPLQAGGDTTQQAQTAMETLAHELVHAMQDRELDLSKSDFASSDETMAFETILEGDARFYEILFVNDLANLGYNQSNIVQAPDREATYDYAHIDELGSPFFAARVLIYPLGARFEATAYHNGGNAAVRHAYANAPKLTVGFLVGSDGRAPAVGSGVACPAARVAGLATTGLDEFGALLYYTFLRGWNVSHTLAFAAAQAWTGDNLRVQSSTDFATTAVAWRIESSVPVPAEIVNALTASRELAVVAGQKSLEITVSDAPAQPTWSPAAACP